MALQFFSVSGVLCVGFTMKSFIIGPLIAKTANNRFETEVCRFSRKIFIFSEVSGSGHISEPRKIRISVDVIGKKSAKKYVFLVFSAFFHFCPYFCPYRPTFNFKHKTLKKL